MATAVSTIMTQISIGPSKNLWGVDAAQNIYHYSGSGTNWTKIQGSLVQVSVGNDGSVWGINAAGNIYHYDGQHPWTQINGYLTQISVGAGNTICGVNPNIYQYQGNGNWTQMTNKGTDLNNNPTTVNLKQVSIASDGTLWAVDGSGGIYWYYNNVWNQMPGNNPSGEGFSMTSGSMVQVLSVGGTTGIFALDSAGHTYTWEGDNPLCWGGLIDPSSGQPSPSNPPPYKPYPTAKYIAFASDGSQSFIDPNGTTWLY